MQRLIYRASLVAGLAALLAACAGPPAEPPAVETAPITTEDDIIAEAKVVPARWAALSFRTDGTIEEVLVREGDSVAAGQVLARLDQAAKAVNLARAEAQLTAAEARLQDLTDGPRREELSAAEAQLRQAQAQLKQTLSSVTPEDITAVQAQIDAAQATLRRLRAGANSSEVRAVQAQLEQAQANLAVQRDQLSAGKTTAELQLSQAADRLVQAQAVYSTARWHWEHVQAHGTDPISPRVTDPSNPEGTRANKLNDTQKQLYHDAFIQAERELHSAELGVQQAQVVAESARQAEAKGLQTAEASVVSAQASLEHITGVVVSEQAAQARSQLAQALASLSRLRGPQRDDQIAVAQAGVDAAAANLARIMSPPQPSELTALEAQVAAARAERDAAQLDVDQTVLRAPFDGLVAALDIRVGETIGASAAVAQLADTAVWQIETTDLTELNIAQVHQGDRAELTFDALPGVTLNGSVLRVKELGENHQGDVVYRVIVLPDQLDARLRWNMTASVAISPSSAAANAQNPSRSAQGEPADR